MSGPTQRWEICLKNVKYVLEQMDASKKAIKLDPMRCVFFISDLVEMMCKHVVYVVATVRVNYLVIMNF